MSPFSRDASREDIRRALEYAYGSFLRFSAMWAMAGFAAAFGTVFLSFSRGQLDLSPLFRELTIGIAAALLGLGHSRYQYYLLQNWPRRYALLSRAAEGRKMPWSLEDRGLAVTHPGRSKVLMAYGGGHRFFRYPDFTPPPGTSAFWYSFFCGRGVLFCAGPFLEARV